MSLEVKIQPKNFPTVTPGKWSQLKRECVAYLEHYASDEYSEENIERYEDGIVAVAMELVYGVDYGKEIRRLQNLREE